MAGVSGQSSDEVAVAAAPASNGAKVLTGSGSQKKQQKPMTREITDSAEIDGLRRQLESVRRTEASSRRNKRTSRCTCGSK